MFHSSVQELSPPKLAVRKSFSLDEDSSVPPLDEVTLGSTLHEEDDDCSSVSSISSSGDFETKPRSIFKAYWDHAGYQNQFSSPDSTKNCEVFSPASIQRLGSQDNDESSTNTYERVLKHHETAVSSSGASPNSRRRIFGQACFSRSYPSLSFESSNGIACRDYPIRKARSASYLTKKPLNSCLRQSRYSGGSQRPIQSPSSSSDQSVVSFRENVDVLVFQTPIEAYAPSGWSDWFA